MPKNDGDIADPSPQDDGPSEMVLVAIDTDLVPSRWCPNGHIVEWLNKETGDRLAYMKLVNADERTITSICMVCGEKAVEVKDGES